MTLHYDIMYSVVIDGPDAVSPTNTRKLIFSQSVRNYMGKKAIVCYKKCPKGLKLTIGLISVQLRMVKIICVSTVRHVLYGKARIKIKAKFENKIYLSHLFTVLFSN